MSNINKPTVQSFTLQIEGKSTTQQFRSIVKDGRWESAKIALADSFEGMTEDMVVSILKGTNTLTGVNELNLEEDTIFQDEDWLMEQYESYFDEVIMLDGVMYKSYKDITMLDKKDCYKVFEDYDFDSLPVNIGNFDYALAFNRLRAGTYCKSKEDKVILSNKRNCWVLFEKIEKNYPSWLSEKEVSKLLNKYLLINHNLSYQDIEDLDNLTLELFKNQADTNNFRTTKKDLDIHSSLDKYFDDIDKSEEYLENFEKYKEKTKKQADEKGGWLTLRDTKNKKEYVVPRNPFYRWCTGYNAVYHTIDWTNIAPKGVKTGSDDPNHTDWYIFTGIDLDNAYDKKVNIFFDKMREKYNKELTNFDFVTLTNQTKNKGIKSANIVHINDPSEIGKIEEDQVIVISEANPDYEMVAHKAAKNNCILITEIGGKLCHLAVVGREFKLVLIQFEDARSKLPEGYNCKVNLLEGKIEVLNEDTNTVLDRKINE